MNEGEKVRSSKRSKEGERAAKRHVTMNFKDNSGAGGYYTQLAAAMSLQIATELGEYFKRAERHSDRKGALVSSICQNGSSVANEEGLLRGERLSDACSI